MSYSTNYLLWFEGKDEYKERFERACEILESCAIRAGSISLLDLLGEHGINVSSIFSFKKFDTVKDLFFGGLPLVWLYRGCIIAA